MGAPKQKWTEEEEVALRKGVERYGPGKWRAIQKDPKYGPFLTQRSNVDLKDKWRIMSRAEGEPPRSRKMYRGTGSRAQRAPSTGSEDDEETAKKKRKRNIFLKYGEMITEAVAALKEKNGSSMTSIAKYIEDNHAVPFNFRRLIGGRLKTMVEEGMLIKGRGQAYRLNDGTPSESFDNTKKVKVKTPRLKSDSERSRSKLELNPDGTKRQKTAEEAAKAAALAIAEAEAAAEAAEQAMREAELAEQEAAEAEAAAEAAAAAVRPPKKRTQKGMAALQEAADGEQPEGFTAQLLGAEQETEQELQNNQGLREFDAGAGPSNSIFENDGLDLGVPREGAGEGLMQPEGLREGWAEPQGLEMVQGLSEKESLAPPAALEQQPAASLPQENEHMLSSGGVEQLEHQQSVQASAPDAGVGHLQILDTQFQGLEALQSRQPVIESDPTPSIAQPNGAPASGAQNPEGLPQAEVLVREDVTQEQLEQVLSTSGRGDASVAAIDDDRGLGMPIDPSEKMEIDASPMDIDKDRDENLETPL